MSSEIIVFDYQDGRDAPMVRMLQGREEAPPAAAAAMLYGFAFGTGGCAGMPGSGAAPPFCTASAIQERVILVTKSKLSRSPYECK